MDVRKKEKISVCNRNRRIGAGSPFTQRVYILCGRYTVYKVVRLWGRCANACKFKHRYKSFNDDA